VNQFFDDLGRRLAEAASREGAAIEPPSLDGEVARELLELARVAAHTQERRFAPLSTFLAGVAAERIRGAFGAVDPAEVARVIREVRESLEKEAEARSNSS
jgi:Domain of unknown function (DUF6457)